MFLFMTFFIFTFYLFFNSSRAIFNFNTFTFSVPNIPSNGFSTALSTTLLTSSTSMPRACAVHGVDVDKLLELVNQEANKAAE